MALITSFIKNDSANFSGENNYNKLSRVSNILKYTKKLKNSIYQVLVINLLVESKGL